MDRRHVYTQCEINERAEKKAECKDVGKKKRRCVNFLGDSF